MFRASSLLHSSFQPPHYPHHHTPSPTSSMFSLGHHPLQTPMVGLPHQRQPELTENSALPVNRINVQNYVYSFDSVFSSLFVIESPL